MKELTLPAHTTYLEQLIEFISTELEGNNCPLKQQMQIMVAVEEIFVNIAHYAYSPKVGKATIRCELSGDPLRIVIQFQDGGKPYNPLEKADPDTALPAEERNIGGLGILMVKKSMDGVDYEYKDGRNILTLHKTI